MSCFYDLFGCDNGPFKCEDNTHVVLSIVLSGGWQNHAINIGGSFPTIEFQITLPQEYEQYEQCEHGLSPTH